MPTHYHVKQAEGLDVPISPTERREKAEKLRIPREKPPTKHRRQDYREIEEAYEELKKQDKKVTENDALDSIKAAVQSMLRVCDNFIEYFPRLISEGSPASTPRMRNSSASGRKYIPKHSP